MLEKNEKDCIGCKKYTMNLNPSPFMAIKSGKKTVEMRLNDERRRDIVVGDLIEFTNTDTGEKLLTRVLNRITYPSFYELYREHDKVSIGYSEDEVANPDDMLLYYSKENIEKYGAIAIVVCVI